jgi:hypothetical protein
MLLFRGDLTVIFFHSFGVLEISSGLPQILDPPLAASCAKVSAKYFSDIWRISSPLKIRVFLWKLVRKRLPSSDNTRHQHGPSMGRCAMCGEWEDT